MLQDSIEKIANWWLYLNEKVADAPETVGDARLLFSEPVVVWDADVVHLRQELGLLSFNLE